MLIPRLTPSQPTECRNVLRLVDATGDHHPVFNPGGFGGPNATRQQMRATIAIHRASDNTIICGETPLPADLFISGREYDLSINLSDAAYLVVVRVYSRYGQPVPLCTYQMEDTYPASARLRVRQNDHWIDVTDLAVVVNGTITWVASYSPDVYSSWQLVHPTSGAVYSSGSVSIMGCRPSPTLTTNGTDETLVGSNSILLVADRQLNQKLALLAMSLVTEPGHHPNAQARLAAWGKLYFDQQAVRLSSADTLPVVIDTKLAALHRMADRLL